MPPNRGGRIGSSTLAISLVGGTTLAKGRFGITLSSAEYRGKIVRVDRAAETITIEPPPPELEAIVDAEISITNPDRRIAYKVLAATSVPVKAELPKGSMVTLAAPGEEL